MTTLFSRTLLGVGRPIVLLHGLASSGTADWPDDEWDGVLGHRPRLVIDLPAHGDSGSLGVAPTSAVTHALAQTIRDALGEVEIDLAGYSLGGRLAWDLAGHPSLRVHRVVLGGVSAREPFAAVDLAAARVAIGGGAAPADPLTGMITHMVSLPGNRPAELLELIEGLAREPFDPQAGGPAVPVLLLGGIDDEMSTGIDELAALLPNARTQRVPGDHLAAVHTPEFREAVSGFLAG